MRNSFFFVILQATIALLLWVGSWGDRVGRRIPVIVPCIAAVLYSVSNLVNAVHMDWAPDILMIGPVWYFCYCIFFKIVGLTLSPILTMLCIQFGLLMSWWLSTWILYICRHNMLDRQIFLVSANVKEINSQNYYQFSFSP